MSLARIQADFQAALLAGEDCVLPHLSTSPRESNDVMFGVYRNAYVFRLADILADDFERFHTYVGDDAFYALAQAYIAAHPSRFASARDFGRGFPAFVAGSDFAHRSPLVSAIARLEGLLCDVFDCADAKPLTLEDLGHVAPADFGRLCLEPHPSVRRMSGPAGLEAAFLALSNNEAPPAPVSTLDEQIIVWRKDVVPHCRTLTCEEAMMWDEAARGVAFARLCELIATYDDPGTAAVRAAGYMQCWIGSGLLSKNIRLA